MATMAPRLLSRRRLEIWTRTPKVIPRGLRPPRAPERMDGVDRFPGLGTLEHAIVLDARPPFQTLELELAHVSGGVKAQFRPACPEAGADTAGVGIAMGDGRHFHGGVEADDPRLRVLGFKDLIVIVIVFGELAVVVEVGNDGGGRCCKVGDGGATLSQKLGQAAAVFLQFRGEWIVGEFEGLARRKRCSRRRRVCGFISVGRLLVVGRRGVAVGDSELV